jgi:site-specific recombinase XerD
MKIHQLIEQFISDADVSESSRVRYGFAIKKFFLWVAANKKEYDKLRRSDIINYNTYLKGEELSQATKKNYFTVVRIFYSWASSNGYHDDIAAGIKSAKDNSEYKKSYLKTEEVQKLFASIKKETEIGARDNAMISLMIYNGLRRSEITTIDCGDFTTRFDKTGVMIQGKGRQAKDQFIQLDDITIDAINDYLVKRYSREDTDPLFTSMNHITKGKRIRATCLSRIIKQRLVSIGLDGKQYSCHSLRHTAAALLIEMNYELNFIQRFMRHKSISTTQLYTRMIEDKMSLEKPLSKALVNLINNNNDKPTE